jgi:CheY-like chemotaxis protein
METTHIVKDYFGASSFIEKNKDKDLIVFIIDDNIPYLNLLKKLLDRPNFSVFTFSTGEESLEYLALHPDLLIIDYHLDSVNPYAMKGDRVAEIVEEKVPNAEIILISSDSKFNLISELHLSSAKNIVFKDEDAIVKIKSASDKMVNNSHVSNLSYKIPFFIVLFSLIIENILLIVLR